MMLWTVRGGVEPRRRRRRRRVRKLVLPFCSVVVDPRLVVIAGRRRADGRQRPARLQRPAARRGVVAGRGGGGQLVEEAAAERQLGAQLAVLGGECVELAAHDAVLASALLPRPSRRLVVALAPVPVRRLVLLAARRRPSVQHRGSLYHRALVM